MDIDPAHVTLALTAAASLAGNAVQTLRSKARKAELEAKASADGAETEKTEAKVVAKAYDDTRTDLTDCRKDLDKMRTSVEAIESSNVVLTHALRKLADQHADCQGGLAEANKRLDGLRDEMDGLRRSLA